VVGVGVDEPRAHQQAVGIDGPVRGVVDRADGHHPAPGNADVCRPGRCAGAVHDGATPDHGVEHAAEPMHGKTACGSVGAVRFDPYGDECHRDPYPVYRALRDGEPVYHDEELGFWALSRFADVVGALHSPATFLSGDGIALEGQARSPYPMIIAMDPPRHDQLRALLARGFTARPVAANAAGVRALARELIEAFADAGRVEFGDAYSGALPLYVIGNLLGIERDGLAEFRRLGNALMDQDPAEPASIEAGKAASAAILEGIVGIIAKRRRAPRDDLVSALLAAEVDGERLREEEVIGFCYLLILAGTETTAN